MSSARDTAASETSRFLQVFAACGFVFARPLLDAFGRSPETFLDETVSRLGIVWFALIATFVPAIVIFALTVWTRVFGPRVRDLVHYVTMGALVAIFVAQALLQAQTWQPAAIWAIALTFGVISGALIWRFRAARLFATYACVAPLLFAVLFLTSSPTADLVRDPKGATAPAAASETPIVFLVLDELPTASLLDGNGGIDPSVFPGFARLAAKTTWYRNHTTVATATHKAVPAIVTGRIPENEDRSATAAAYPESLFTYLGTSYTINADEGLEAVCPARLCARAPGGGLPAVLDLATEVWNERFSRKEETPTIAFDVTVGGNDRAPRLEAFADRAGQTGGPHLDYFHSLLPHEPFEIVPSGRRYETRAKDGLNPFFFGWLDDESARVARITHLLQLQYTDRQVSRLLDRLEASGRFDETLLVVTADHGIAFNGAEGVRGIQPSNAVDIAWTPLFIKAPGQQAARVDDRIARTIDIVPTVADIIGAPYPWPVDGQSLLGSPPASDERVLSPNKIDEFPLDEAGHVVLDGRAGFQELLARPAAYAGTDELAVFRGGDFGALIGTRTDQLGAGPAFDGTYRIDEPPVTYDPNAPVVPVNLHAEVKVPANTTVALVVNGRVAGWYTVTGERARFMIPEPLLRAGPNDVSIAVVEGPPDDATLRPLRPG